MRYHLIQKHSVGAVLEKARQYRLLQEPELAISICLDVFAVLPDHQETLEIYILALVDRMGDATIRHKKITDAIARLKSEFQRHYYHGIFLERKARNLLKNPMSRSFVYAGLVEAMAAYQLAEKAAPEGCADPILRYNSCLRTIEKERLKPRVEFDELY